MGASVAAAAYEHAKAGEDKQRGGEGVEAGGGLEAPSLATRIRPRRKGW